MLVASIAIIDKNGCPKKVVFKATYLKRVCNIGIITNTDIDIESFNICQFLLTLMG